MRLSKLIVILSVGLIVGCASSPKYEVLPSWSAKELAEVTIYRTKTFFHSGNPERPFFYIDGKLVGKLGTGMSVTTKVESGKHIVTVREPFLFMPSYESERFEYDFKAGENYYLRYSKDFSGVSIVGGSAFATGSSMFSLSNEASYRERK